MSASVIIKITITVTSGLLKRTDDGMYNANIKGYEKLKTERLIGEKEQTTPEIPLANHHNY